MIDLWVDLALFAVAVLAGFVDSIAGGGGLLTIPALLWSGMSPAHTLATNKVQACFGSGSASWQFIRANQTDPRDFILAIATCGTGAALGALSINRLDPIWLQTLIPGLLLAAAAFFIFCPVTPHKTGLIRLGPRGYALLAASSIGFYDGFFGPGTGSFLVLSLVTLAGMEIGPATARTKVLNFSSNVASFAVFAFGNQIIWKVGLIMAVGQAIGARMGARLVVTKGAVIIRPALVIISVLLTIRIIATSQAGPWHDLLIWLQIGN